METIEQLPAGVSPMKSNKNYAALLQAVQEACGKWIRIDAGEVRGATPGEKVTSLHVAAKRRGMRVEVAIDADKLYVRRIDTQTEIL